MINNNDSEEDDDYGDDGEFPFSQRCKFRVGSYSYDSSKMVFITKVPLMIIIMTMAYESWAQNTL